MIIRAPGPLERPLAAERPSCLEAAGVLIDYPTRRCAMHAPLFPLDFLAVRMRDD